MAANWPEPWKYIVFPEVGLKISTSDDGETLTLSCQRPIKGIVLDVEDRSSDAKDGEVKWSDQAIDLMPEDDQVVLAKGLKARKVVARVSCRRIQSEEWELTRLMNSTSGTGPLSYRQNVYHRLINMYWAVSVMVCMDKYTGTELEGQTGRRLNRVAISHGGG